MRAKPARRGFILMLVLIIGVAALAVAIGLVAATGKYGEAVGHSLGGDQAMNLAQSGMERVEAWAAKIASTDVDFDRALDPDLIVSGSGTDAAYCDFTVTPSIVLGAQTGVPEFTDGTIYTDAAFMNGTQFRLVPYGGGAYLVHTEDNDDDGVDFGSFAPGTGNSVGTKGSATFCGEGGTIAGANNYVRDRDNAIWVTSIGIYPGTDPLKATHRAMMRKLVIDPIVTPPAAFVVGNTLTRAGAGTFIGSNSKGSVQVGVNIMGAPSFCGTVQAGGPTNSSAAFPGPPTCTTVGNPYVNQANATVTPTPVAGARDGSWFDYTSPCNLYADALGLYWWDTTRAQCSGHVGALPIPSNADATLVAGCWAPLAIATGPVDAALAPQVVASGPGCFNFQPAGGPGPGPSTGVAMPAFTYYLTGPIATATPDWRQECPGTLATQFLWPSLANSLPGASALPRCSTCDGATPAFEWCSGGTVNFTGNVEAYPAVTLFVAGSLTNPSIPAPAVVPTQQGPPAKWPMITLIVENDLTLNGANPFFIGVGSKKGQFPSIVVGNSVTHTGSGPLAVAGGFYVFNTVSTTGSGALDFYGPIHVTNDFQKGGSGAMRWDYDADMVGSTAAAPPPPPLILYPTNF